MRRDIVGLSLVVLVFAAVAPTSAAAQATAAGIAGVVRDTTGALLPGVTVEAASFALIEKVRIAVTNEQGQYQIVDLRPGSYTVTFTLPGFRTLRREGVELSVGFTANITADMELGGVEETITVSGAAPLVDVRTTAISETFTRETMDELPTTKNFATMAVLIPGVIVAGVAGGQQLQDVGGTMGERNPTLMFHGSAAGDMPMNVDGMKVSNASGTGAGSFNEWVANNGIVQEVMFETSGFTAETETSGLRINQITKSGGNVFSGSFFGAYTNDGFQTDNLNDEQRTLGLSRYVTKKVWDINPAFGGPILQDKVWFFYSYRHWGTDDQPPGTFYEGNPFDFVFDPDRSRPAVASAWVEAHNLRLTWQASPKHKLSFYGDNLGGCNCTRLIGPNLAPEAAQNRLTPMNHFVQAIWNWTLSNRLFVDAAQVRRGADFNYYQYSFFEEGARAALDGIQVVDTGRGVTYRALGPVNLSRSFLYPGKANVSYVTGSHHLKAGAQWTTSRNIVESNKIWSNSGVEHAYTFVNGVPTSVTYVARAIVRDNVKLGLGIYAQDQWTMNRFTLNLGARLDHHNAYIPAQHVPATRYVGTRDFPQYDNLPNWKDISPRFGVAYDLFGNGKTALKWSMGRFVEALATAIAGDVNPARAAAANRTTRAWTDRNGDFVPQEDELGPSSNTNFGTSNVGIRYDPDLITGWGKRAVNWEWSLGVQQELRPGLSVDAGYFRRTRGNFRVTDNTLVTSANYDPYCVTTPSDPRLPGGGGTPLCGLYNINPSVFGRNDNVITLADHFGKRTEIFDGVDVNVNVRLPGRATLQGGTSTGRIKTNSCFVIDSPEQLLNCDVNPPFLTQVKLMATYPLPWWGLRTSATYQSLPGPEIIASWAAPAAAVTGLGRPLAGNVRSVTVPLIEPGTLYGERLHQIDARVAKGFTVGSIDVEPQLDIYNVLNANVAIRQNNTYGASWQVPTAVLGGRLAKFGLLIRF